MQIEISMPSSQNSTKSEYLSNIP